MQLQWCAIEQLLPYKRNPRLNQKAVNKVAKSLASFGWQQPIVVDKNYCIVVGHTRYEAAKKLQMKQLPVIIATNLKPKQVKAYRLADNKLGQFSEWNKLLLAEELNALGQNYATIAGFSESEQTLLMHLLNKQPEPTPKIQKDQPLTQIGDCWQLGEHRIVCGDARKKSVVAALMGRETASLLITDPPYGLDYGGNRKSGSTPKAARVKAFDAIAGDGRSKSDLKALLLKSLKNARLFLQPGSAQYIFGHWRTISVFNSAFEKLSIQPSACIVWDKRSIGIGESHYRGQHEFIYYFKGELWRGARSQGDIWSSPRVRYQTVHPTQKPQPLIERALVNSSKPKDIVLDIFAGSGTTILACEARGRVARAIEIEPKYVDIAILKWQQLTGQKARLISSHN